MSSLVLKACCLGSINGLRWQISWHSSEYQLQKLLDSDSTLGNLSQHGYCLLIIDGDFRDFHKFEGHFHNFPLRDTTLKTPQHRSKPNRGSFCQQKINEMDWQKESQPDRLPEYDWQRNCSRNCWVALSDGIPAIHVQKLSVSVPISRIAIYPIHGSE